MKRLLSLLAAIATLFLSAPASAQKEASGYDGCEGPAELCDEVYSLREKLDELEALTEEKEAEVDLKDEEAARKVRKAKAEKEAETEQNAARSIVIAAAAAVALRQILQALKSWTGYFKTDRAKAWLKIGTIVIGLAAFLATNLGMGIPWWQALILAGGGPAAMAVDGIIKLVPVLLGKKKLADVEQEPVPEPAPPTDLSVKP